MSNLVNLAPLGSRRYENDCKHCAFIGWYENFDLYVCYSNVSNADPGDGIQIITFLESVSDYEYLDSIRTGLSKPEFVYAKKLAHQLGVMKDG